MALPRRIILIASSVSLILFIALSLATAFEVRAPHTRFVQVTVAQAARVGGDVGVVAAKALLNGTGFDCSDMWRGTSIVSDLTPLPTRTTETQEGIIGLTQTPRASKSWSEEGVLGPKPTPTPSVIAAPQPPSSTHIPILALTYSGSGGPKHYRGNLIEKTFFPPPLEAWKNGTCINLRSEARCGVFFASKGDNCEAQLFNVADCYNITRTYINTVVFMPEERAVGALWSSMYVRCGIEVPEAKMLDPSILGGALKKPAPPAGT